jgi:dienelactone hydrolase
LDPAYHPLLGTLASYGFVVLAPKSCPSNFCPKALADDLGAVLSICKANRKLHPGLKNANFTRVGVVGHSMGGTSAGYMAAANGTSQHQVHAYVGLHGTPIYHESGLSMPTLYTTGGKDDIVFPSVVHSSFKASVNAYPRVFVQLSDADHFEPTDPLPGHYRLNPYAAQFLLCHVAGRQDGCGLIYDAKNAQSLCNAYADKFDSPHGKCEIVQTRPIKLALPFQNAVTRPKRGVGDGKHCYRGDLDSLNGTSW